MIHRSRVKRLLAAAAVACALFLPASGWAADANRLLREALKYYERGQYERAIKRFVKVLEVDPGHALAKEYMMLCSQKIVEQKLGSDAAETVEKEVAVEKLLQERQAEIAEAKMEEAKPAEAALAAAPSDEAFLEELPMGTTAQADLTKDIMRQRDTLTDQFRRRHLGRENIVQIDESKRQITVTLFMNRLFLPYSDVLRDDAYLALDHVAASIRKAPGRRVTLRQVDASSAYAQSVMPDLPNRRALVLVSYLVDGAYKEAGAAQ